MILDIPSANAIAAGLKGLQWDREYRERNRKRRERFSAYAGESLLSEVSRYYPPDMIQEVPPSLDKVTQKLVNTRAQVNKEAPVRDGDERYLDMLKDLNAAMIPFERAAFLQGDMAMLRLYHPESQQIQTTRIPYFEPIFQKGDDEPIGCAYPVGKVQDDAWIVWTIAEHFRVTKGLVERATHESEGYDNPLGVLPIVFARSRVNLDDGWYSPGADDLVNAQLTFNCANTLLSLGMHYQALGQPYATGLQSGDSKLVMNVRQILSLPDGAGFGFASSQADLQVIRDSARAKIESAAYANDMVIKWGDGRVATSGEMLELMEIDLRNAVRSDQTVWRDFEERRFEVDRAILDSFGITISDEYSVDFAEPHVPETWTEKEKRLTWMLDRGMITQRRAMKSINPDLTDEQIDELLAEVQEEKLAEVQAAPQSTGNGLLDALTRPVQ